MGSFFDLSSLRGKITGAYIVLVAGTAALGVIAFLDLMFLERQVLEGEVASALKDAVLEMRREEKNLFLYMDDRVLARADEYALKSLDILQRNRDALDAIERDSKPSSTISALQQYRMLLGRWLDASPTLREPLGDEIRALGHGIQRAVDLLANQERRMLEGAVQKSQRYLLLFMLIVGLAIYFVGRRLKRAVVTPLKQLESRLMPIAEGRFNHLQAPSHDREFLTFTDAFNRMLRELEVRQRRMLQSEKLASLGTLSSGVAHELNNPLSNISTSCQLLMEELGEADTEQLNIWLRQIDAETERGRKIVRTLLDFGSQRVFQRNRTKLLELIGETQTILGKTLRQSEVGLTVDVPADLTLALDKQRIQQLFINLIQNSLHAAGAGVQVSISARVCREGVPALPVGAEVAGNLRCLNDFQGGVVEIVVTDDGPGIPHDVLGNVFDPFFTTSEPGKGVGLGLFIAQEIVGEHEGCLAIVSRPGEGTRVIVLLPEEDSVLG